MRKFLLLATAFFYSTSFSSCSNGNHNDFTHGSGITALALSSAKTGDLVILGKVWGYLKYYHPYVAKGKYQWDYELFKILPLIIEAKDRKARNEILSAWIDTLGSLNENPASSSLRIHKAVDENTAGIKSDKEIKMKPDLDWCNDVSSLGDRLVHQLNEIKNAQRKNSESYYVTVEGEVQNAQFNNEKPYEELKYPDAGFRLLSLFRYWNIIQYFYPYKYLIEENWNTMLPEFIPQFINAGNELEYKIATIKLIGHVHDTHATLMCRDTVWSNYIGVNYPFIAIGLIEDKVVVRKVLKKSLAQEIKLRVGDVILAINNKKVDDIIKEKLFLCPASNYSKQVHDFVSSYLLSTNDTSLNISYMHEGEVHFVNLACYPRKKWNIDVEYLKKDTCFSYVSFPNIVRIFPGSIKNNYLPEVMPKILNAKGIVVDMRCYPSEFIVFSLSKYLMPRPTSFVKFTIPNISNAGLFTFDTTLQVGKNNEEYYKGKIVILVNEKTQSQAEYTTMAFRAAPNVTVIGSTTAGADGNVSNITLVGGLSTWISGIGIYYPDGRETQRIGIVPDIEVHPTIKGITEGKDELLEKAIEIINKK